MNTPLKIFLVEDDVDEICFYTDAIKEGQMKMEMSFFQNAEGVFPFLENLAIDQLPDAIISDLNMPKLNGYQLLIQLKSSEKYGAIPVFICSNSASPVDKEKCMKGGAAEYIVKPVRFSFYSDVLNKVANHLNGGE